MIDTPNILIPSSGTRLTDEEFFALPESSNRVELINGVLIVSPSSTPKHQDTVLGTVFLLKTISKKIGGKVYVSPMDVRLDVGVTPQPDVLWIAPESRCIVGEKRLDGPPDLVVEVFSPGSIRYDRREKFEIYERYGIFEYWMIDPEEQYIEVYRRENEHFVRQGIYAPEETFTSTVLNSTEISVNEIFSA